MGAVHGHQQCETAQEQRHSRRLAAFSAPNTDTHNIHRRQGYDQPGSYGLTTGSSSNERADATSAGTYFGRTSASSYEPYIPLDDDDASMHTPEEPNQTTIDSITDLATTALANVEMLQELLNFVSEDQASVDIGIINFSLLGGTNDTTITDPTA
jgi:hypothetical protein